jgi:hypothetical protein
MACLRAPTELALLYRSARITIMVLELKVPHGSAKSLSTTEVSSLL